MAYDEFFTDGDKPYAENLNDSLVLLDAFDVTVPVEMPTMFNNGQFSSTANVARKCGIGIVTLKSVASGVTVGTSSISGTGEIVFRVYPNFNAFYKWQSIILEKTGTVSIAFKKTDGTSISTTINNDGVISEVSALKTLQEIDVVLTLSSATISKILINFVNNQNTRSRTGALLDAHQLINADTSISGTSENVVQNKTIKAALDGKANSTHTHTKSQITDFSHTHTKSQITDFAHTHFATELTDANSYSYSNLDVGGSANQSTINAKLDAIIGALYGWEEIPFSNATGGGTLWVNDALRIAEMYFHRENLDFDSSFVSVGYFPKAYCPKAERVWCETSKPTTSAYVKKADTTYIHLYANTLAHDGGIECYAVWHY